MHETQGLKKRFTRYTLAELNVKKQVQEQDV